MTVIERRECPEHGTETGVLWPPGPGRNYAGCGHCGSRLEMVKYVPATELEGAGETQRELAEAILSLAEDAGMPDTYRERRSTALWGGRP